MKSIHLSPERYATIERACAMQNMMTDRAKLPASWKVDVPLGKDVNSFSPVIFGVAMIHREECRFLEGFMLGMAIASGTISIGKCREWARIANISGAHELANFGGAIRDEFAKGEL